jgi:hypothetical protein
LMYSSALTRTIVRNAKPSRCVLIMWAPGIDLIQYKIDFPRFMVRDISILVGYSVMPST